MRSLLILPFLVVLFPLHVFATCLEGNCRHGNGIEEYAGGKRYEGEFLYGKPNGDGVYYFSDGSSYASFWADGKPHGKGLFKYPDGRIFQGSFIKGRPMGSGPETQALKEKLIGNFAREVPEDPILSKKKRPLSIMDSFARE